jgi:hypothetical protein
MLMQRPSALQLQGYELPLTSEVFLSSIPQTLKTNPIKSARISFDNPF